MTNTVLINELAKLQVLTKRYVERNSNLRCSTFRDMNRLIMNGKLTCTYSLAAETLYNNIKKYCNKSAYLLEKCTLLKESINNSDIKDLRFGLQPQRKFSKLENELDLAFEKRQFFMLNEMISIKDMVDVLDNKVSETAIKQACQQERLMNTSKVGKAWLVHIPECRAYWDINDNDETHLYNNWEY